MKGKLLPLVVLVLAIVGAIAWWAVRGSGARGLERAENSRTALQSEAQGQLAVESQPLEARSAEKGEASPTSGFRGGAHPTGTLRVRVLDEKTRAPVPDLGLHVYSERGGDADLADGRTDPQGRAEFPGLEPNTILVCTERRPPYASRVGGAWLVAGAAKELEILLGPGSAVTGRVVDERKQPVADASFFLAEKKCRLDDSDPLARSGADGRFRVECLSSTPRGVWIVGGTTRPESWIPAELTLVKDVVQRPVHADVKDGADLDLGDVEIERGASFAGTVISADRRGVAGALVSARDERESAYHYTGTATLMGPFRSGPADAGFQLAAKETLSESTGAFELCVAPGEEHVHVWTLDGQFQTFDLPHSLPGERKEGLILELASVTRIDLDLVDSRGNRIRPRQPGPARGSVRTSWNRFELNWAGRLGVDVRTLDGRTVESTATCAANGIWRAQLPLDAPSIDELVVNLFGYEEVRDRVAGSLPARASRKYTLVELPRFHMRVIPLGTGEAGSDECNAILGIQACLGDPERREALLRGGGAVSCCGSGSSWDGTWDGKPLEFELPVRTRGAFWIYVYARAWEGDTETSSVLGPFHPDDSLHEVVLDTRKLKVPGQDREADEQSVPPGPGGSERLRATLLAEIVDARTGKGVDDAMLSFESEVRGKSSDLATSDASGRVKETQFPGGRWSVQVDARHYRHLELGVRETQAGKTLDLGRIALEPLPLHRGRVVRADGKPAPGLQVSESSGTGDEIWGRIEAETREDGSFEFHGDLSQHALVDVVQEPSDDGDVRGAQRFAVDSWPDGEVQVFELAPLRRVLVRLTGAADSKVKLYVCPAAGEATANCDPGKPDSHCPGALAYAREIDADSISRRFVVCLAPGRYQVWGGGMLYDVPATELKVAAGEGDLELTVVAR